MTENVDLFDSRTLSKLPRSILEELELSHIEANLKVPLKGRRLLVTSEDETKRAAKYREVFVKKQTVEGTTPRLVQRWSGQIRSVSSGQIRSCQIRSGQVRPSGQLKPAQNRGLFSQTPSGVKEAIGRVFKVPPTKIKALYKNDGVLVEIEHTEQVEDLAESATILAEITA